MTHMCTLLLPNAEMEMMMLVAKMERMIMMAKLELEMMMMLVAVMERAPFQWRSRSCFPRQRQHKSWIARMMIKSHQNL